MPGGKAGFDPDQLERAAMMGRAPTTTLDVGNMEEQPQVAVAMVPPSVARLQQQQQQQQQHAAPTSSTAFAQRFLSEQDSDGEDDGLLALPASSTRTSSSTSTNTIAANVFQTRKDFYEVDQSVNLMDADTGTYHQPSARPSGFGSAMVDIFFHDDGHDSPDVVDMRGKHKGGGAVANRVREVCCNPYILVLIVLVAALPVVLWVSANRATSTSTTSTTTTATTSTTNADAKTRLDAIQKLVLDDEISRSKDVDDLASATLQALHWMAEHDHHTVNVAAANTTTQNGKDVALEQTQILQRYTLAVLYFAVRNQQIDKDPQHDPNNRRRRQLGGGTYAPVDDGLAQLAQENHKRFRDSWLAPDQHVCTWWGVQCQNGHQSLVTHIDLPNALLQGTLPRELLAGNALPQLTMLSLPYNHIQGALPDWSAEEAQYNNDNGNDQSHRHGLPKLERLILHHNEFAGALPAHTLESLTSLVELDLSFNEFSGRLPVLGSKALPNIGEVYFDSNQLTGPIDPMLVLTNLEHLSLAGNQLSGKISSNIQKLSNLKQLKLNNNNLTGQLPIDLGKLTALEKLDLMSNKLVGTVPTQWSALYQLESLHLQETSLTGVVPQAVCNLTKDHRLKTLKTDCKSGEIKCDCCADCV